MLSLPHRLRDGLHREEDSYMRVDSYARVNSNARIDSYMGNSYLWENSIRPVKNSSCVSYGRFDYIFVKIDHVSVHVSLSFDHLICVCDHSLPLAMHCSRISFARKCPIWHHLLLPCSIVIVITSVQSLSRIVLSDIHVPLRGRIIS